MAVFDTYESKKRLWLPSTEGLEDSDDNKAWVVMDVSPSKVGDVELADVPGINAGIAMIASRIREWNYTDLQGKPLEVSYDNVKLIKMGDFRFLQRQIAAADELSDAEKKTSLTTPLPSVTDEPPQLA